MKEFLLRRLYLIDLLVNRIEREMINNGCHPNPDRLIQTLINFGCHAIIPELRKTSLYDLSSLRDWITKLVNVKYLDKMKHLHKKYCRRQK